MQRTFKKYAEIYKIIIRKFSVKPFSKGLRGGCGRGEVPPGKGGIRKCQK